MCITQIFTVTNLIFKQFLMLYDRTTTTNCPKCNTKTFLRIKKQRKASIPFLENKAKGASLPNNRSVGE